MDPLVPFLRIIQCDSRTHTHIDNCSCSPGDWEADLSLRPGPGAREVVGGHPRTHPEAGSMYTACMCKVFALQSATVCKFEYHSFTFEEVTNCSKSTAVFLRKPFLLQPFRWTLNQGSCCIELAQVLGRGFHHLSHSYRDLACHFPHCASMQDAHGTVLCGVQHVTIEIWLGMISVI